MQKVSNRCYYGTKILNLYVFNSILKKTLNLKVLLVKDHLQLFIRLKELQIISMLLLKYLKKRKF